MSAGRSYTFITRAEAADRIVTPGVWSARAIGTVSPPGVEAEAVDLPLFRRITAADTFVNRTCVACGCHAALFISAGRYVVLCSLCTAQRIAAYRRDEPGGIEPDWIGILDREARGEVARQARLEESELTVTLTDVWKCSRCGRPIRQSETRYHHAPGENGGPPYCAPCAEALQAEDDAGS